MVSLCKGQRLELQMDTMNSYMNSPGDTIRKYFAFSSYSYPTPRYYRNKNYTTALKEPYLVIGAFYAKRLAINYFFAHEKIPELATFTNDTSFFKVQYYDSYSGKHAIPLFDSSGIIVTVNGINRENAAQYEFRILENKTQVVVPWTRPRLFCKAYLSTYIAQKDKRDRTVAYLGQFKNEFGKSLTIQVRKIDQPNVIQVALSAVWINQQPTVIATFAPAQLSDFLETIKRQWLPNKHNEPLADWTKGYPALQLRHEFEPDENNLIFYLDEIVESKEIIEYNLVHGNDSTGWKANDFNQNFIWLRDLQPGQYKLHIRYSVQRQHVAVYPFTITPAWYQTVWFKAGIVAVSVLATGFIILLFKARRQTRRLKMQDIQKQLVQTQLKSIRSQFNPHFVFNSLNSVQAFITKNEPDKANQYLMEFSTLMRNSLKESNHEFVSITKETDMLISYLNLEQLRFGFSYTIDIDQSIDAHAVEIPGLLLQPLVENAIKHGISSLHEQGKLGVSFEKEGTDMLVGVTDNGKGITDDSDNGGFGLKLTRERIRLLNETLEDQHIALTISREKEMTYVAIHFKNWLI